MDVRYAKKTELRANCVAVMAKVWRRRGQNMLRQYTTTVVAAGNFRRTRTSRGRTMVASRAIEMAAPHVDHIGDPQAEPSTLRRIFG
jgi:hypothetical protein